MPLHIGLLGIEDPADVRSYSGTPYHLAHALRELGHTVRICGPYQLRWKRLLLGVNRLLYRATKTHLVWERTSLIADQYGEVVDKYALANQDLDFFLATSVFYAARKKSSIPVVAWGDTTVQGVLERYPYYTSLSKRMIAQSHAIEQRGLSACDAVIFSSEWAAQVALDAYDLDPAKVHVITYGANILEHPAPELFEALLEQRKKTSPIVVLVGVDWKRKGVDKAIEAVNHLRRRGSSVRLRVIGCRPPSGVTVPDYVDVIGRIPKSTPEGQALFNDMLKTSHVFVLPSVAECAAVSLVEANALGLPVVASDVGGNPSLVKSGVNGYLCDPGASGEVWADALQSVLQDAGTYEALSRSAYNLYKREYQWSAAALRFERLMYDVLPALAGRRSD